MNPAEYRKAIGELSQVAPDPGRAQGPEPEAVRAGPRRLEGQVAGRAARRPARRLADRGAPEPAPAGDRGQGRRRDPPPAVRAGAGRGRRQEGPRDARPPGEAPRRGRRGPVPRLAAQEVGQGQEARRSQAHARPNPTANAHRQTQRGGPPMIRRLALLGALALASTPRSGSPSPTSRSARPASGSRPRTSQEVPDFQRHVLTADGPAGLQHPVVPRLVPGAGRASGSRSSATTSRPTARPCSRPAPSASSSTTPKARRSSPSRPWPCPTRGASGWSADSWQYRLLVRWIEGGAQGGREGAALRPARGHPGRDRLPARPARRSPLKVVAHWADGELRGRHLPDPVPDQRRVDRRGRRGRRDHLGRPGRHPRRRLLRQRRRRRPGPPAGLRPGRRRSTRTSRRRPRSTSWSWPS